MAVAARSYPTSSPNPLSVTSFQNKGGAVDGEGEPDSKGGRPD